MDKLKGNRSGISSSSSSTTGRRSTSRSSIASADSPTAILKKIAIEMATKEISLIEARKVNANTPVKPKNNTKPPRRSLKPSIQTIPISKSPTTTSTFSKGEEVLAFDGIWLYDATIIDTKAFNNHLGFQIHYEGWTDDHDEVVTSDRLMEATEEAKAIKAKIEALDDTFPQTPPSRNLQRNLEESQKFVRNEKVIVYHCGLMYKARIVEVLEEIDDLEGSYHVHYDGWKKDQDEWLNGGRMLKVTPTCEEIKSKLSKFRNKVKPRHEKKAKPKSSKLNVTLPTEQFNFESKCENEDKLYFFKALKRKIPPYEPSDEIDCNYKKYISKRSQAKGYERQIAIWQKEVQELEAENIELREAMTYNHCQKCKRHYLEFQNPKCKLDKRKRKVGEKDIHSCSPNTSNSSKENNEIPKMAVTHDKKRQREPDTTNESLGATEPIKTKRQCTSMQ